MRYPFNDLTGLDLSPAYEKARETPGPTRVELPFGEPAWLVTRYDEARLVLGDNRFIGAANRDPDRFTEADTLDMSSDAHGHLSFGYGLHRCVGAALGRVELREALRGFVTRLPELRLAGDVEWKADTFFRGPLARPITW